MEERPDEFWQEEIQRDRRDMRRQFVKYGALFLVLLAALFFALWWSSSAVHHSASRIREEGGPTYRVHGVVRDAVSGQAVAWAEIADDPQGRPPHFRTTADLEGNFELMTVAEPHNILVMAHGYKAKAIGVGKAWYLWMPSGAEQLEIRLERE